MLTNILQSIGRTPLLRLNALGADLPGTVWLKLENRNPGGSIKDRVAFHVIDKTMEWGDIEAGGTIVEATSGNLGIGIALVAAVRGLHCVLTMPDSMSVERRNLLHALGAELVLTPAAEGMKGAIKVAEKLAEERNGLLFGQFSNPLAVEAHYLTTGPEILADSVGHMDVLVAGVGSGSSASSRRTSPASRSWLWNRRNPPSFPADRPDSTASRASGPISCPPSWTAACWTRSSRCPRRRPWLRHAA